jgi:RND superfamily putative drug exporter
MKKLGLLTYSFPKTLIILWVIILASLSYSAINLPAMLQGSGFNVDGQFQEVENILKDDFDIPESTLILLFEGSTQMDDTEFKEIIKKTLEDIETVDAVDRIVSPLENEDMIEGNTAYATILSNTHFEEMKLPIEEIRSKISTDDDIFMGLTGGPVINEDMSVASQKDLIRAELIGVPIALVILIFAFGGLVAASIPLIIGFVTVLCSMGALYFTGHTLNLSIFLLNVVPMIGLALGIDFALLLVNRFREELEKHPIKEAIQISVSTAGRSVIFSGICVFLGLSGLLFIDIDIFKTVAIGGMVVVLFSVISAITLLPAILSLLGHRINRLMILKEKKNTSDTVWRSLGKFVMKYPIMMSLSALIILSLAIIPIFDMELTIPDAEALPPHYESRITYEKFQEIFISEDSSAVVMIAEGIETFEGEYELQQLEAFIRKLENDPLVSHVESIFSLAGNLSAGEFYAMLQNPDMKQQIQPLLDQMTSENKTLLNVTINANDHSVLAKDWVREWEQKESGLIIKIGGYAKFHQEIFDEIYNKIPYVLLVVFLSTYIVLFIAFRSLLIPIKAIIMNVASLSATFGILVWLFQGGHFGLDPASIGLMIPVLIFGIVFGLSMDYEVFLISRMHEIYTETKDNDYATLEGLISTSKLITSAALIIIVITGAFAFTGVVPVKQIGLGMALAILIDATIVRMILVPSLMKLLGNWNWWAPSLFSRKHQVINEKGNNE